MNVIVTIGSQLSKQRKVLHSDVEEEYSDLLAGNPFQSSRRARYSAEAGGFSLWARADDEELTLAHRRYRQPSRASI